MAWHVAGTVIYLERDLTVAERTQWRNEKIVFPTNPQYVLAQGWVDHHPTGMKLKVTGKIVKQRLGRGGPFTSWFELDVGPTDSEPRLWLFPESFIHAMITDGKWCVDNANSLVGESDYVLYNRIRQTQKRSFFAAHNGYDALSPEERFKILTAHLQYLLTTLLFIGRIELQMESQIDHICILKCSGVPTMVRRRQASSRTASSTW